MKPTDLAAVTQWITAAAVTDGPQLPETVCARLGITRRAAQALLRRLQAAQWLVREGSARQPAWRPGPLRQVVQRYPLAGLQEDLPWRRDFAPFFVLPVEVARMAEHAFTELLNNAADHSGGTQVTVSLRQTPMHVQMLVSDDGCGLFQRIQQSFEIADPTLAMLELAKGKLTSQAGRHSGHGLFFTARLADVFDLHANDLAFQFRGWDHRSWFRGRSIDRPGTAVYLAIALDTARTADEVILSHSLDGASPAFERTVVPLQLIAGSGGGLESRALARRVAARLGRFRRAEIDFHGIERIGHAFADELFRVTAAEHPSLDLVPVGMAPRVASMVDAVRCAAA